LKHEKKSKRIVKKERSQERNRIVEKERNRIVEKEMSGVVEKENKVAVIIK